MPNTIWCMLLLQAVDRPCSFALASDGNNKPAKMAMIAMTTSNSISVKPRANDRAPDGGEVSFELIMVLFPNPNTAAPARVAQSCAIAADPQLCVWRHTAAARDNTTRILESQSPLQTIQVSDSAFHDSSVP